MNDFSPNRTILLRDLIEAKCIFRAPQHKLVSSSGKSLKWLIDLRPLLLSAQGLDTLAEIFWNRYADQLPFQVGGMEMAAVPLVAAILMAGARKGHSLSGFIIHKERKRYGRMNAIEGDVSDAPIVLVDDIFNSGTSIEQSRVVLAEINRAIWKVWSVIDYESCAGETWQKRHGVTVDSAYRLSDFGLKLSTPKSQSTQLSFIVRWLNSAASANHHYVVPKSAPRAQNGLIYFGTDSGEMRCVDGATGETRWNFKIDATSSKGIWSTPHVTPERVFFGGYDGNLYALCAQSGLEIWRYVEPDWIGSSPAYAADLKLVFIGVEYSSPTRGGGIAAIDAETGDKVWEYPVRCYVHGSPLYTADGSLVLCGTNDGALLALDALTGALRWQFQTKGAIKHAPALDAERRQVVFGSFDGGIRGIKLDSGELNFCIETGNAVYTTPLIDGTRAYCGSTDKYLYVIDLVTGKGIAKIGAHSKIFSSPARIGPWIWFGSTNGRVRAIDPETFELAGVFQLPDAITSAVEYDPVNQMIVAASTANRLYGVSVMPPVVHATAQSRGGQARIDVTALQLARLTVDAIVNHAPLPDPEGYRLTGASPHGGVFVSLRNQTTLQRVGRGGQWTFDAADASPEMSVIAAVTKACANLSADSLRNTAVSVSLFGRLEQASFGQLDHEKFGIVVRATAGAKLGGALPNSPEYSSERGQYFHALRNARLAPGEGHTLYRHTVERQTEHSGWPAYGAPFPYEPAELTRFVSWLLDPHQRDEPKDSGYGLTDRLSAIAVTRRVGNTLAALDTALTTTLLPVARAQALHDLKEAITSQRVGSEAILLSLVFKGRDVDRSRCRGHFRIDRDALICRSGVGAQVFLPISTLLGGMDEETLIASLPDPPAATWEIAPCLTWAVTDEANPLLLHGGFVKRDEQTHGHGTNVDVWLRDMARNVAHRLERITPEKPTYLPDEDRYVAAENGLDEYVELVLAFEQAGNLLGENTWTQMAQRRLVDITESIAIHAERWTELRTTIAWLVLRDVQQRAGKTGMQTTGSSGSLIELREWILAQPLRPHVGLDLLLAIHLAMQTTEPDLRRFVSIVKAELSKVRTLEIQRADRVAEAAVCLIRAGHRELIRPLVDAAMFIAMSQHPVAHIFPHASKWGGTADTARVMKMISCAWAVLDTPALERPALAAAWRNGWRVIERLRIGHGNAPFAKSLEHAEGVQRDDEAGTRASAAASAATLEILTHALSSVS
ncbi:TPA: hypothetical protein QDE50_30670 [Burkholderia cenocepacia]|nr:hypothetical protein [Burkholderia cenocepacia]HDR9888556.1 hypothetical protein [Burkholderia cenocepacia]